MPPYNPPNAHYNQIDVSDFSIEEMLYAIGKNGHRFKKMTADTGTQYIWFDKERNVVEIWASFEAFYFEDVKNKIYTALNAARAKYQYYNCNAEEVNEESRRDIERMCGEFNLINP